jgi:hypothetical protein
MKYQDDYDEGDDYGIEEDCMEIKDVKKEINPLQQEIKKEVLEIPKNKELKQTENAVNSNQIKLESINTIDRPKKNKLDSLFDNKADKVYYFCKFNRKVYPKINNKLSLIKNLIFKI